MESQTGMSMALRRCPINKEPITKVLCERISFTADGNEKCHELDCDSPFRGCFVCLEQASEEQLVIIGLHAYVKALGCCRLHANDKTANILEAPAVIKRLEKHERSRTNGVKSIDADDFDETETFDLVGPVLPPGYLPGPGDKESETPPGECGGAAADGSVGQALNSVETEDGAAKTNQPTDSPIASLTLSKGESVLSVKMLIPSTVGPRKSFSEDELVGLSLKLKFDGQSDPLIVQKRGECYEIFRGEDVWLAAKNLRQETLQVKFLERPFSDEAEEYLAALMANRTIFTSLELARLLKDLSDAQTGDELKERIAGYANENFDACEWLDQHLKILTLHSKLIRLMEADIPSSQRLDLTKVLRYKLFELTSDEQEKRGEQLIAMYCIDKPSENRQPETQTSQAEAGHEENAKRKFFDALASWIQENGPGKKLPMELLKQYARCQG